MKRVLIVGNQGYIGTALSQFLTERNYEVLGLDLGRFAECKISDINNEIETVRKSATDLSEKDILHFDVVINLAGNSNDPENQSDPKNYYKESEEFSLRIAEYCKKLRIKYIFPSSCSVYGESEGICDEESSPNPLTAYSKSKMAIENGLSDLSSDDFCPIVLRLATVFGYSPRMRFDIVINMFAGMLLTKNEIALNSNGLSWRPHLYITDACKAFQCAIDWDINSGKMEVINVGNNENNFTIIDAAKKLLEFFPQGKLRVLDKDEEIFSDQNIKDGKDARDYRVNFDKVYNYLPGFDVRTGLMEGTKMLIDDLRANTINRKIFMDDKYYRLRFLEKYSNWDIVNKIQ